MNRQEAQDLERGTELNVISTPFGGEAFLGESVTFKEYDSELELIVVEETFLTFSITRLELIP